MKFRGNDLERRMWANAVCINLQDGAEKSVQVWPMMTICANTTLAV
jgi:hypothetical protein